MAVFSLAPKAQEEAPIQLLKKVWGVVVSGEEPWRTICTKSRIMFGTSLAYDKAKGETLAVSLKEGNWDLRVFKDRPGMVEEALHHGTSLPHSWEVVYHGTDVVEATGAFVRWCLS